MAAYDRASDPPQPLVFGEAAASDDRRAAALRWALAAVGVALLALLVWQTGPRDLATRVQAMGWALALVFVPYGVASVIDAAGWKITFEHARPPLWLLYVTRLGGEALNTLTPTAYLGGEPVKVWTLRRFGVPVDEAAASVILAKTALTVSQIAFVVLGTVLLLHAREASWTNLFVIGPLVVIGGAVTALLVRWQQHGLLGSAARGLRALFPRLGLVARLEKSAAVVDARLRAFYAARPRAAVASVALHLAGWIVGALEVLVILTLLGHPVRWDEAVIIEALAQPIRLLGLFVPGALGVQEAGGMMLLGLLGMPPDLGLTLMLLKRLREITYSILGLGLLALLRPRASRAA